MMIVRIILADLANTIIFSNNNICPPLLIFISKDLELLESYGNNQIIRLISSDSN